MRTRVRETNKLKWFYLFYRPKASRYYRCFTKYNNHIKYTKARLHDSTAPRTAHPWSTSRAGAGSRSPLATPLINLVRSAVLNNLMTINMLRSALYIDVKKSVG